MKTATLTPATYSQQTYKNQAFMSTSKPNTAWHYTHAKRLKSIMADGVLRTRNHLTHSIFGIETTSKPQVWFTLNDYWEPSIYPELEARFKHPDFSSFVKEALQTSGGSWVRFGIPADTLWPVHLGWPRLAAETPAVQNTVLDWRVSFKDVSIEHCKIDFMYDDLVWKRVHTPKHTWLN